MTAREAAREHYDARQALAVAAASEAARLWGGIDVATLDSWARSAARLLLILAAAQRVAANMADRYVERALREQGLDLVSLGEVNPARFSGVSSQGRSLDRLLWSPVVSTRIHLRRGESAERSLASGAATLDMIVRTQVADAGRVSDGVAIAARPGAGYVRLLVGDSCSRCAVLAGRWYRYSDGFRRHPRCDCTHIPSSNASARDDELVADPRAYFDSLSEAQQDRLFTKAGAQAIRDGADIAQVVNSRRGMSTAGGRVTTTSAARGAIRLMPEQIYREAASRDEAVRLLREHGFIR